MSRARPPGGRLQLLLDALLLAWTVGWLAIGVLVAYEVRGLADLSDAASKTGRAVVAVGDAVKELPLVGDRLEEPADAVRDAGAEAVASSRSARASARRVGVLLGVSIAAIPSLPVLLLYLPARLSTSRERRELRRAVSGGSDPAVDELLALRAVTHLPFRALRAVSDDPAGDVARGRHGALADAELDWFGVIRPRGRAAARR
jgi:hypothetical protein